MSPSGDVPFYTREAYEMYNSIAKGGAGIVTLGEAGVHSLTDHAHPTMPHLDDETLLPSLIQTVDTVHKWGALASIELTHSGCRAKGAFLAEGGYVIGPSPMEANLYGDKVIEMDEDMMDMIADAYAQAAYMAEFAGCDIVNIHGGHGWLISQFLSDLNNHRTDKYSGSIENKARFPLMIVDRIRQKCPNLIIEFRLSGEEETEGGIPIEETIEFAKMLDGKVDIIHVSAATFHDTSSSARMFPTVFYPRGCNVENARQGKPEEITKCIRCETCISAGFIPHVPFSSGVLRCSVNPTWGREYENTRKEEPVAYAKKVLVAGGGPGGMAAAITAAKRGHHVILCEKNDHLASSLDYAKQISFKKDIVQFLKSMVINVQRTPNLELRLNTEVTEKLIAQEKPDTLIVACGSEPVIPPIPGIDKPISNHITDLYKKHLSVGKKVVIIGGGLAGCEEGLDLAWKGHDVSIIEMRDGLAKDAPYIHWRHLLEKLEDAVTSYCNAKVLSIEDSGVKMVDETGKEMLLEANTVLIAAGMKGTLPNFVNWHELAEEVIFVGDCRKPSKIQEAMRTGYCAGVTI